MSPQYGELRPTSGWDRFVSLGHPCKFQRVSDLGNAALQYWASAKLCGVEQRVPPIFGRAANTLGIGPVWVKKGCHPKHVYNFVNSWSICKILSLLQRAVNFQQKQYDVTHHTLSMLLHYLGKLKNQKFAILMHEKHVSSVTFYHLSNK